MSSKPSNMGTCPYCRSVTLPGDTICYTCGRVLANIRSKQFAAEQQFNQGSIETTYMKIRGDFFLRWPALWTRTGTTKVFAHTVFVTAGVMLRGVSPILEGEEPTNCSSGAPGPRDRRNIGVSCLQGPSLSCGSAQAHRRHLFIAI